jgi:hypothetical protein
MNTAQDRYRPPQMKASDADRDAVVAALSDHFQAGRLTSEEFEERTGRALAARSLGQLDELTVDLPAPRSAATAGPTAPVAPLRRRGYLPMVPLVVPLAVLAIVALTLGTGAGMHAWRIWWVIPVALLIVRRLAWGRGIRRDFRRR